MYMSSTMNASGEGHVVRSLFLHVPSLVGTCVSYLIGRVSL